ncbi:hypothetical protein PV328_006187 [Microctonus aethiopoides]|uniref:Eukaryotic translation initiation factor 3 subunit C N-terminal domain-containing protein n=1 Tax=Microctonus aethiopoides TaxID=144406 RepID=A0AA39FPB7_9HYME|nr:hypothetical protein PV328_006187 [Microctonus aethiopoides]
MSIYATTGMTSDSECSSEDDICHVPANGFTNKVRPNGKGKYVKLQDSFYFIKNYKKIQDFSSRYPSFKNLDKAYLILLTIATMDRKGGSISLSVLQHLIDVAEYIDGIREDSKGRKNMLKNNSKSSTSQSQLFKKYKCEKEILKHDKNSVEEEKLEDDSSSDDDEGFPNFYNESEFTKMLFNTTCKQLNYYNSDSDNESNNDDIQHQNICPRTFPRVSYIFSKSFNIGLNLFSAIVAAILVLSVGYQQFLCWF